MKQYVLLVCVVAVCSGCPEDAPEAMVGLPSSPSDAAAVPSAVDAGVRTPRGITVLTTPTGGVADAGSPIVTTSNAAQISGVVNAASGAALSGTIVFACATTADSEDCDLTRSQGVEITFDAPASTWAFNLATDAQYVIEAWSDVNESGEVDDGDLYGAFSVDGVNEALVVPPQSGLVFSMAVVDDTPTQLPAGGGPDVQETQPPQIQVAPPPAWIVGRWHTADRNDRLEIRADGRFHREGNIGGLTAGSRCGSIASLSQDGYASIDEGSSAITFYIAAGRSDPITGCSYGGSAAGATVGTSDEIVICACLPKVENGVILWLDINCPSRASTFVPG